MPIRSDQLDRYPPEWPAISAWVKFDRAMGRCECWGECGSRLHWDWVARAFPSFGLYSDPPRCPNYHGEMSRFTGSRVVLTTAHLDHAPENNDQSNLLAMCQACHLAYDRDHHAATRAAGKAASHG